MSPQREEPPEPIPPPAPAGYRDAVVFRYPAWVVFGLVALLAGPTVIGFGALLWYGQGSGALGAVFDLRETGAGGFSVSLPGTVVLVVVGTVVAVTVLHELVHGVVYRLLGYEVTYGVAPHVGAFYTAAFGQFQTRTDNLLVGAAPLVVLTLLFVPLLFVPVPHLAVAAFVGLVFNTLGAAGDCYLVGRLLLTPTRTLLYDRDIRHSYAYYPRTGEAEGSGR